MNNDKLLIIVLVLTLYLTCFRRSEGQETEMICKYTEGQLDGIIQSVVGNMFGSKVDDSGKFTGPLTIDSGLVLIDPNQNKEPISMGNWKQNTDRIPTIRIMDKNNEGGYSLDGSKVHLYKCNLTDKGKKYNDCQFISGLTE